MTQDKFVAYWQPKHEKGLLKYLAKYVGLLAFVQIFSIFFFSYINHTLDVVHTTALALYNLGFLVIYTILMLFHWFGTEREYNQIITERGQAKQEAQFRKTCETHR